MLQYVVRDEDHARGLLTVCYEPTFERCKIRYDKYGLVNFGARLEREPPGREVERCEMSLNHSSTRSNAVENLLHR